MRLEIPMLQVNAPIVGIPLDNGSWNVYAGLDSSSVGYLQGSAYPTWVGNSVLTGHVVDAYGVPAIFSNLRDLETGDKVLVHFGGQVFVYAVRENRAILPTAVDAAFQHETYNWVTLLTCEDWNAGRGAYSYRRLVRAVLISVIPEQ